MFPGTYSFLLIKNQRAKCTFAHYYKGFSFLTKSGCGLEDDNKNLCSAEERRTSIVEVIHRVPAIGSRNSLLSDLVLSGHDNWGVTGEGLQRLDTLMCV